MFPDLGARAEPGTGSIASFSHEPATLVASISRTDLAALFSNDQPNAG
ncbi:hypothetical protein ACPOL_0791 [Acidisarcina polymorpha]|uniref:Uncharacterized protein n=1 Tax=Acidisarcina polymorpha TaxID=2211140 RepID=A0A2Z5FTY0_9BACT|nr:hypothetical protein ACPOL_0791 [Acidisarcina polymorpha]